MFFWKRGETGNKCSLSKKEKAAVEDIVNRVKDAGIGEVKSFMSNYGNGSEETTAWKEEDGNIAFTQYGKDHSHYGYINMKTGEVLRSDEIKPDD